MTALHEAHGTRSRTDEAPFHSTQTLEYTNRHTLFDKAFATPLHQESPLLLLPLLFLGYHESFVLRSFSFVLGFPILCTIISFSATPHRFRLLVK